MPEIVEICCGQRNGLHSLRKLGFARLAGVDLWQRLFRNIGEPPPCMFVIAGYLSMTSKDIVIVQGGRTTLKLFPTIFSRLSRKQREF